MPRIFQDQVNVILGAAGRSQCPNFGLGIERRRPRSFISWAVNRPPCRKYPLSWENRRTSSKLLNDRGAASFAKKGTRADAARAGPLARRIGGKMSKGVKYIIP